MEGNYWIRPLIECLAISFSMIAGVAYIVARVTRRTFEELLDWLVDLLSR